ncbi:MAG: hypothetical protein AAGK14_01615 [Verrucomicrobiota bacterium]
MATLPRQRIRLRLDTAGSDQALDERTSAAPVLWRGTDVQFELGLFRGATLLSVANLAAVTLEVKANSVAGLVGGALMQGSDGSPDDTLAAETWADETQQHALIAFTGAETNLDLGDGNREQTFWLVASATTTDDPTRTIVLGSALLTIRESGAGADAPTPSPITEFYTKTETDDLLAETAQVRFGITGLTGGTAADLDGQATTGSGSGGFAPGAAVLFKDTAADEVKGFHLRTGGADSANGSTLIAPTDDATLLWEQFL